MKLSLASGVIAVLLLIAAIVSYSALFTVNQTKQALLVRLGQPVRVITEPGLNVKVPFIDNVIYVDKRILDLESPAQEVIASDQKRLVVDAFARYRITDPLKFYQTVGESGASSQLAILLNSALRSVLGGATLVDVVRNMREQLMSQVRGQLDHEAQQFGIQVVDVRIRRADLPKENSDAIYQRMKKERERQAAEYRAQGDEIAQRIRARAERDRGRDHEMQAFHWQDFHRSDSLRAVLFVALGGHRLGAREDDSRVAACACQGRRLDRTRPRVCS